MPSGRAVGGLLPHEQALAVLGERSRRLDELCREAGREPSAVSHSWLFVESYVSPLPEPGRFAEIANDFAETGVDEMIVYWPKREDQLPRLEAIIDLVRRA